jgi:hypothetical protein
MVEAWDDNADRISELMKTWHHVGRDDTNSFQMLRRLQASRM